MDIEQVIDLLCNTNDIPRADISRMVKSEFKVTFNTVKEKGDKECNLIFIGTFKPTPYRVKQLKNE